MRVMFDVLADPHRHHLGDVQPLGVLVVPAGQPVQHGPELQGSAARGRALRCGPRVAVKALPTFAVCGAVEFPFVEPGGVRPARLAD